MASRKDTAKDRVDKGLGKRLADARNAKGYTQKEMADYFGITQQAYQNYEYGREMKSSMIVKVCALLECSPSWLLGVKETGKQLPPESPLLIALKDSFNQLNEKGKRKVVGYAQDMTGNSQYVVRTKKEMQGDSVPKAVNE